MVWHSSLTCQQSHQLEQLQRRACRIIMGCEFISYSDALQKCDLVTLSCRRRNHCQLFAERLSKSICTADLLPPTRHDTHSRNLRNSHHISQLRIKTSRYKNSPIPFFIDLLNEHSQPLACHDMSFHHQHSYTNFSVHFTFCVFLAILSLCLFVILAVLV